MCAKHFKEDDVEPRFPIETEVIEKYQKRPKQKDGAVPTVLPGCSRYYSSHTASKCTRLSLENKDDEPLYQAVRLSLELEVEENENLKIRDCTGSTFFGSGRIRILPDL